jgi:SNF2 family DNA or RNA helicase
MVINKQVVEDWLSRDLRDSRRAKLFTTAALNAKLEALDPPPKFYTKPRKHQKVGFLLGLKYPGYLFTWDMGLGKSKLMLDLFSYRRRRYYRQFEDTSKAPRYRMIVLVPGSANVGQWRNEVKVHAPHLSCAGIDVSGSAERMLLIRGDSDIVVITYMGFLSLVCKGKIVLDKETGETKLDPKTGEPQTKGWTIDKKKLREFTRMFKFFTGDESTYFKNHTTLLYRAVKKLAWGCECRYGLTGTPYGKNVEDLWAQFNVVDKGETLGATIGLFRQAFFVEKDNFWSGGTDWKFDERKKRALNRMLRHGSLRYNKSECLDLPPKVPTKWPVYFDPETWGYYDKLVQQIKASRGAMDVAENAFLSMRQLTAGYLRLKDAEGGDQIIKFKRAPKVEALVEYVNALPADSKFIVFHEYVRSGEVICEALKKNKTKHVWLYSKAKKKNELVQRFLDDDKTRCMVSSSAGAYGGNWQTAM